MLGVHTSNRHIASIVIAGSPFERDNVSAFYIRQIENKTFGCYFHTVINAMQLYPEGRRTLSKMVSFTRDRCRHVTEDGIVLWSGKLNREDVPPQLVFRLIEATPPIMKRHSKYRWCPWIYASI